ncbi:MAG: hypothetical protein PHE52_02965 [Candidatus Pacebacteria bacterium]|nr:hypothetical protein [Candidatus Paceibacterota bacterium]
MKVLIAYYSKSGGTEKLAEALEKEFRSRGHAVDIERIKSAKEHSFLGWWHLRMVKSDCDIQPPKINDVSQYDVVCIGSPNWTRLSLPVARYLREVKGLKYKNIGFFASTAAWPQIEWYILSAYLLDLTFAGVVNKRGGRIIDSILLSSVFKKWSWASDYGRKVIKNFCDKLENPIPSLKKYFLEEREIENSRLLVVILSIILLSSLLLQIFTWLIGKEFLTWSEYFYLFLIEFIAYFAMLTILTGRFFAFLGKYLASLALIAGLTIAILFLTPTLGRPIIFGYILIFILFSFFRDPKSILFTAGLVVLAYFYLFFNYPSEGILLPYLDLPFIVSSAAIVGFVAKNLQDHYLNLLGAQEETEIAKAALEVRVLARTRELKVLSESLEEQVKERTKKLEEKMAELERFNKLSVGRELKMIELKEEIKDLEKELGNSKVKNQKNNKT